MANNKLPAGIIIGAIAGGLLSMLDPATRRKTSSALVKSKESISYYSRHPQELADRAAQKADHWKQTAEKIQQDIAYLSEKYEEVKEMVPQLQQMVSETKDAFTEDEPLEKTAAHPVQLDQGDSYPEKKTV
ncbi:hypothetical protein [Jeotgalibacillus sp. R-1-5s-1]|uniref:hypothetical protein n=1 Tax=Jeotgalibacillus sp. R-1-5s-1 TaxID=2555897 RepID=UPI00106D3310|nr:hypothetical protein [Jeotgalibacillus sp. R-1-5s-1]TFE01226.1 hypothetical protein E2491_04225 [Jeotgalibacillus sp. R-1-5s-1]